jgi:hypothetical protein
MHSCGLFQLIIQLAENIHEQEHAFIGYMLHAHWSRSRSRSRGIYFSNWTCCSKLRCVIRRTNVWTSVWYHARIHAYILTLNVTCALIHESTWCWVYVLAHLMLAIHTCIRYTSSWPNLYCNSDVFTCRQKNVMVTPCNIDATCVQQRCNTNATQMQHRCNTDATQMQHKMQRRCNTDATQMQHRCNTDATQMQHRCNTNATQMQHRCNTEACVRLQTHTALPFHAHFHNPEPETSNFVSLYKWIIT